METIQVQSQIIELSKEEKELLQTTLAMANMLDVAVIKRVCGAAYANTDFTIEFEFHCDRISSSADLLLELHCVYSCSGLSVKKFRLVGSKLRDSKKILTLLQAKIREGVLLNGA